MTTPMTPQHPRWDEFCERLEGPEGCNFVEADNELKAAWTCDRSLARPLATAILFAMGLTVEDVAGSLEYFEAHGGYCDCEILFNVDQ